MQLKLDPHNLAACLSGSGYTLSRSAPDTEAGWLSLYNTTGFFSFGKEEEKESFFLLGNKNDLAAVLHVYCSVNGTATSLPGVPFAGPEHTFLSDQTLTCFLRFCLACLKERDLQEVILHLPAPEVYSWAKSAERVLQKLGFTEIAQQVNHHLIVGPQVEDNFHPSAKRRMRKSQKAAFLFSCENEKWEEVYDFILACRIQKDWQLSLKKEALQHQKTAFPDRYYFFGLRKGNQLIAATIGVLVTPNVLYSYAPAHDPDFSTFSPVILLHKEISGWAAKKGIEILDLGTSMLGNKVNLPLAAFKERLGGILSYKKSFSLHLTGN